MKSKSPLGRQFSRYLPLCICLVLFANPVSLLARAPSHPAIHVDREFYVTHPNFYERGESAAARVVLPDNFLPPVTFQWYHDNAAIPGANSPEFTIESIESDHAGTYHLDIVTPMGRVRARGNLVINTGYEFTESIDPSFVQTPLSQESLDSRKLEGFLSDDRLLVSYGSETGRGWVVLAVDGSNLLSFEHPDRDAELLHITKKDQLVFSKAPFILNASGIPQSFVLPTMFIPEAGLQEAASLADGRLYLRQGRTILRCLADGSIDPDFTPIEGRHRFSIDAAGRVYVSRRTSFSVSDDVYWTPYCDRHLEDGSRDESFTQIRGRYDSSPFDLIVTPFIDGKILVYYSKPQANQLSSLELYNEDGTKSQPEIRPLQFPATDSPAIDVERGLVYVNTSFGFPFNMVRLRIAENTLERDTPYYFGRRSVSMFHPKVSPTGKVYATFYDGSSWHLPPQGFFRLQTNLETPSDLPPAIGVNSDQGPDSKEFVISAEVETNHSFTSEWIPLDGQEMHLEPSPGEIPQIRITSWEQTGRYQLRVTDPYRTTLSEVIDTRLQRSPVALANFSGRGQPGLGENTMIAGFTLEDNGMSILIRGVGPTLSEYGVESPVTDPAIRIFDASQTEISFNDNWGDDAPTSVDKLLRGTGRAGAFPMAEGSADAAVIEFLNSDDTTTAHLQVPNEDSRVALIEVYNASFETRPERPRSLKNLSLRVRTQPDEGVSIAGFVLNDPSGLGEPTRILMRAVGPSLSAHGIADPLTSPRLILRNSNGELIADSTDWSNESSAEGITYAANLVGAFPLDPTLTDAALLLELPPGAYTMAAESNDSTQTSGVVLLEIYIVRSSRRAY